jgi:outer membrane protein assembly factor BamA
MAIHIPCGIVLMLLLGISDSAQSPHKVPEHPGYTLAALNIAEATAVPREQLLAAFPIKVGDPVDMRRIRQGLERVQQLFQEAGYLDFTFTPSMNFDHAAKTLSCSFELWEGSQYTVRRIDLVGDSPLSDRQMRSALLSAGLEEGKVFRPSLIPKAIENLNRLMGGRQISPKGEFIRPAKYPSTVDVTIRLR